ncbi:hypothetical protein GJ744_006631 [Endocarpon pusillum]|uniref:Spindle assembly checkpoint component MAD1 n=1 Tax=Endocarpon pusillum TaxID=364733 RepID=A0A8H7E9B5_9EURO|nr:hypothetical protein GJ744_006631 [Endocarpon pusillum]
MIGKKRLPRSVDWETERGRLLHIYTTWLESALPTKTASTMSDEPTHFIDLDQPIALRRSKRRSDAISPSKPTATGSAVHNSDNGAPHTPSRTRSKKRVRFSNPGSLIATSSAASSGLTPYIGRATLSTPRRRASTPAATRGEPLEIQFTPFRAVLDSRTQRRLRRNGLSQEMNAYESERRDKAQLEKALHAKDHELEELKKQLEAAKHENAVAHHSTVEELSSNQKIVEAELEDLRQSFNEGNMPAGFDDDMDINWDAVNVHKAVAPPCPASDSGDTIPIYDDDAAVLEPNTPDGRNRFSTHSEPVDTTIDEEILAMALDLESAKQEKRKLFNDVRGHVPTLQPVPSSSTNLGASLHFEDSPAPSTQGQQQRQPCLATSTTSLASPPKTFYADLSKTLKSTIHRAENAELALHNLEADLRTLGFGPSDDDFSTSSILDNIRAHFRQARLDLERALPGETPSGLHESAQVLPEAISKLKLLSRRVQEREAELRSMHEQQRTLKGNFECGLRAAEKANQRIKELEEAIEEGADDLLAMRMKLQASEKDGVEKDHTIASLITALEKYRADVTRLEGLVIQLENLQSFKVQETHDSSSQRIEDLEAEVAAESTGRHKAEESAVQRLAKIQALNAALEAANSDASALQIQLSTLEAQKAESELRLQQTSQEKDQQHENSVQNLNTRLSTLSTALATSQAESTRLNGLVGKLQSRLRISEDASTRAVEALWQEQIRALTKCSEIRKSYVRGCKVRGANWEMEDEDDVAEASGEGEPLTPVSLVRFVDVEEDNEGEAAGPGRERSEEDVNGEGEVEGRVEMERGRRRSRSSSVVKKSNLARRGLGIEMSMGMGLDARKKRAASGGAGRRRKRRFDSGIGMGCLDEEEDEMETDTELLSSDAMLPSSDPDFDIHEDASELALPSSELGMEGATVMGQE